MDSNRYRPTGNLGINKTSRIIRKSPVHHPTLSNPKPPPPVYNINKSDFRSFVQQLTGTPTRDPSPSYNPPNPPTNTRLHKVRPTPLAPVTRPPLPHPNSNFYSRPAPPPTAVPPAQYPLAPFSPLLPPTPPPGSAFWANTQESPISAYMRYLECSILNNDGSRQAAQQMGQLQQMRHPHISSHPPPPPSQLQQGRALVAGPPDYAAAPFPSPRAVGNPIPTPPGLLPSPTSQFLLPSPSAFLNFLSPRSPFPLLSPRLPMTPSFPFSPTGGHQGLLGVGLPSPGSPVFPLSPSGFVPAMSPRWRKL